MLEYGVAGIPISGEADTLPEEQKIEWPSIEQRRRRFDEARTSLLPSQTEAIKARRYFDGPGQLDSEVRRLLSARGQPPIYTNRIRPAVNGVLGVLEGSRTDPRAYPRNPDDEQSADIATKALRFIADQTRFGDVKQDVADNFLVEGTGAVIVEMDEQKIVPTQIRYEEFYCDPYSRRADFLDATYMGIARWTDAEQIKTKYHIRINEIGDPMRPLDAGGIGEMYQDRPEGMGWIDIRRRRVMLVEEYALERGVWHRTVYIAAGILEHGPSPYMEYVEGGGQRPCNPIVAQSCYVNRENGRYGMVLDMMPIQDEINASRSRSLHLMNMSQIQCVDPSSPPVSADEVRVEASKADGVIPMGWQKIDNSEMTQANMVRMQEAKSEIERMGPTPAIIGRNVSESASGRSKQVSQQAGMTELARPLGRLSSWEYRCYAQMWFRAKQFWTDQKFIRVTDETRAPEFLKVNEPVTINQALAAAMQGDQEAIAALGQVIPPEALQAAAQGDEMAVMMIQQFAMTNGQQPVMVKNRLAEIDVDIILDTVPDTANLQEEVFNTIIDLYKSGIDPFSPQGEFVIEMAPLQDKTRIIERLKKAREEGMQQQAEQAAKVAQMEEEARQLAMQQAQVDIAKTASEVEYNAARTENTQADTMRTMFEPLQQPNQTGNE